MTPIADVVRLPNGVVDLSGELQEIDVPTVLIWGDEDASVLQEVRETMATAIADSRTIIYPGAGHARTLEEPQRLASDLATFCEEISDAR